jgi:PAS domain S-box-containing protein
LSEHDLLPEVELARQRLSALCSRLQEQGTASEAAELTSAMGDLRDVLTKLQTRYGLLRDILDHSTDAVFAKDTDGRYLMINSRGAEMLGLPMERIVGNNDTAFLDPQEARRIMALDREVMTTGEPQTREEKLDRLGVVSTVSTTSTAWYDSQGALRGLIGTRHDVTGRRQSERGEEIRQERLRALASETVIAEERLRQSLAAELHNGIGQDIALAKMRLARLRSSVSADLHESLKEIEELLEQADRAVRSITFQISPPSLHDLGLVPALQWLAEEIGRQHRFHVGIEDADSPTVANERVRVLLFRAVRELLHNARMHANVKAAFVRLSGDKGLVRITVEDEGTGFDGVNLDRKGYGLFGVREQVEYMGGSVNIDSSLGGGTRVTLTAPLEPKLPARS